MGTYHVLRFVVEGGNKRKFSEQMITTFFIVLIGPNVGPQ